MARCCSCGDEVACGSDVWVVDCYSTACSPLCYYQVVALATNGMWHRSQDDLAQSGRLRVGAARKALLRDPDAFSCYECSIKVQREGDMTSMYQWARASVLEVGGIGVRLEVYGGDCEYDEWVAWGDVLDWQIQGLG